MQTKQAKLRRTATLKPAFGLLVSLVTFLAAAPKVHAQSGTWTNLVNGNASGTWSTAANWNNGIVANGADSTADFSTLNITTNSTVTVDITPTIGNLIFGDTAPDSTQATNWVLTGGTLTLQVSSGVPTITANNGTNIISTVLAGTMGFNKAGAGIIRLNGANNITLSSNININAGILQVGNANALGATTPNGSATLSNAVVIAPGATIQALPTIQPNLHPTYVGGTGVGGTQGAIYADLSSQAQNQNNTRYCIGLLTAASPAVIMTNDTTIRVDGTNIEALGSVMLIGHITTSNAITGHIANDTNITLTKTGTGRLSIDPATGYSGGNIHVAQGGLRFGNNNDILGFQTVTVDAGTRLQCGNVSSLNSANSTIVLNDQLDIDANPTVTTVGAQVIGYLSGSSSGYITNGGLGAAQASMLTIGGTNGSTTTFSGTIVKTVDGSVGLRIQNTNSTLKLTGANTYQGVTIINAGTLLVNGSHIGVGGYTVASGATLGGLGTISAAVTDNGGTILAGDPSSPDGTLAISNNITGTSSGSIIISNATLAVNGSIGASGQIISTLYMDNGTLQIPISTVGPSTYVSALNVDGGSTISFSMSTPLLGQYPIISYSSIGGLAGFSGLSLVAPAGIVATLSNNVANSTIDVVIAAIPVLTWNGVPDGDWDIGTSTNWQGGLAYTEPGGTELIALFDDTAHGTTSVNLTTTLTPKSVTVNNNSLNYTFSGSGHISGAGGLAKQGSGMLTVANSGNNFTGSVTLQQGTLQVGNGGTTGDLSTGPLANSGTLALNRSDTFTLANTVSGNGNITKAGAGAVTVPFSGDSTGAVTVTTGTLQLAPSGTSTLSGNVTGGGAFGVNGAGTVILTGNGNNYSSGTVISNGALQFGDGLGNGALPPAGSITDNGTLALALGGTLANNVSGSGGISIVSNANVTFGGSETYAGPTLVLGGSVTATASSYPSGSVLTLGDQAAGTVMGTANFIAGNPVIGGLNAGGQSSTLYDTINLGAGGQTLTINGNVSMGYVGPVGAAASSLSFQAIGSGSSVVVNTNGGIIQIGLGATGSGVNPDNVFVDFSQIDNFVANLGASTNGTNSALNMGTLDGNPGSPGVLGGVANQLILAAVSNSITAGTINIGAGGRQLIPDLRLGSGTNVFNVGTFNVGTGGRDGGQMEFNTGSGGVQIRGAAGGSTSANYNQGVNTTATGAGFLTTVDFTGGYADLLFGPMVIGNEPARVGLWTNLFTFNQGVLTAASVSLSQGANSNADYSVMNINGGTATLGPVSLAASTAGFGILNINGGTVTVANITHTGSGTAMLSLDNATLNLSLTNSGNPFTAPVVVSSFSASDTVNLGLSGSAFTVGQFPLISYSGSIGGSGYSALNLTSLPAGVGGYLSNNVANLSVDVVITNAPAVVSTNPATANFKFIVTGGVGSQALNFSWAPDHLGWQLYTNSTGLTATASWFPVPGSAAVTNESITIDPSKANIFFQLRYP
jgi:autotransporter-associated beta strand protein